MTRRARLWLVAAALFTLANLAGAVYAALLGELRHGGLHVVLALLGAYVVSRLTADPRRDDLPGVARADERLEQLQQSLDSIALEVERIGEAQRFSLKLQAEERAEIQR
jgi:hypothetical protein